MIGIPLRIIINETVLCIGEIFGCSDKVTKNLMRRKKKEDILADISSTYS